MRSAGSKFMPAVNHGPEGAPTGHPQISILPACDDAASDSTMTAMKNLLRVAVVALSLTLLSGCANQADKAAPKTLNVNCVVSGEPVDAGVTVDYMGGKLAFCCDKCKAKWVAMDEATKKKTYDAAMAKSTKK
jgi:hypothetical protein